MRLAPLAAAAVAAVLLACAAPARAAGPGLLIGSSEDAVKTHSLVEAKSKMSILKLAGFDSVRITSVWWPGEAKPDDPEILQIRNTVNAARLSGVRVFLSVYHFGSRTTPLTDESRAEFVEYTVWLAQNFQYIRDFVIGNEPNLNRFWLPQFNEDGSDAAAPAYMELLAETYDALKKVSPQITVIGGTLAPRGIDRPGSGRDTHSPSQFIRDLGVAYAVSGRRTPIMDQIAMHPYGENSSQQPKKSKHPNTTIGIADYDKLVRILGQSFDGTAQKGSTLPIVYEEFGIESQIPKNKLGRYKGTEPKVTKPVTEKKQAAYYKQAIQLAFCQTNVRALMLFHIFDEPARAGWQSGLFYADGRPKMSLIGVRRSIAESRRGVVDRCRGLALTPRVLKLAWPRGRISATKPVRISLTCSIDCAYTARIEPARGGKAIATARGTAVGKVLTKIVVKPKPATKGKKAKKPAAGRYHLRLSLVAPVNPGPPLTLTSPTLTLG
jgi:hypothetical protein